MAEGARVVFADVNAEGGAQLAAGLGEATRYRQVDVTRSEELQGLVDFTVAEFGGLDILFNNAGISGAQYPRFLDDDLADFRRVIDTNLYSVMVVITSYSIHYTKLYDRGLRLMSFYRFAPGFPQCPLRQRGPRLC